MTIGKEEIKGVVNKCLLDIGVFSKTLFPDYFEREFTPLHLQIIDKFNKQISDLFKGVLPKPVVISAPRGIGKTSLTISVVSHSILFDLTPFIVYVSSSADTAEEHTEDIKNRLLESERVRAIFGDVSLDSGERYGVEGSFSKKSWVAFGRTLVLPRGAGQRVRGRLFRGRRPGLIVIDDFEDEVEVRNDAVRKANKQWLLGTLLKCVDKGRNDWRVIYIDTLKHQDSVLVDLLEMETWDSLKLSSCDQNLNSLIPEFISTDELKREYEEHRATGTLPQFYMERMGEPMAGGDSSFNSSYFRYYNETDREFREEIEPGLENLVLYDPAKTTNPSSAWTAIVGVGFHAKRSSIYVRDIVAGMMHPDQQYDEVFKMAQRLKARVIGLEVTGLNEFITYPFRTAMLHRGLNYEVIELKARKGEGEFSTWGRGKEGRVASLIPFYRKGQIFHNSSCCIPLETQLLSYPLSKRWDVMDAFAYVVEILDMGLRYFEPEEQEETPEEVEREFEDDFWAEDLEEVDVDMEAI